MPLGGKALLIAVRSVFDGDAFFDERALGGEELHLQADDLHGVGGDDGKGLACLARIAFGIYCGDNRAREVVGYGNIVRRETPWTGSSNSRVECIGLRVATGTARVGDSLAKALALLPLFFRFFAWLRRRTSDDGLPLNLLEYKGS